MIELLIAAALGCLVVAAVVAAFAGGLRVWERMRGGTSPALDAALAVEWLQRDLHNATASRLGAFEGTAGRVRVPGLVAVTGVPGSFALQDVVYAAPAGRGTLERSAVPRPGSQGSPAGEVLVSGLESVRFAYRDGAGGRWAADWTGRTNRPSAVEVVFRFTPDRGGLEIRRTMLIPGA